MGLTIEVMDKLKADIVAAASEHMNCVMVSCKLYSSNPDVLKVNISGFKWWAETCNTTEIEHFTDWKQAFKSRWLPEWLQRKYPIKYIRHTIESQAVYPEFKWSPPDDSVITLDKNITSGELDDIKAWVMEQQGEIKVAREGEIKVAKDTAIYKGVTLYKYYTIATSVSAELSLMELLLTGELAHVTTQDLQEFLACKLTDMIIQQMQESLTGTLYRFPPIAITHPNGWKQWLLQAAKETSLAPLLRNASPLTITHNFSVESVTEGIKPSLDEEAVFRVFVAGVVEVERVGGVEVKAI